MIPAPAHLTSWDSATNYQRRLLVASRARSLRYARAMTR
jgi:hypothetical protein